MSQGESFIQRKNVGFVKWQSITSTAVFLLSKTLFFSLFTTNSLAPTFLAIGTFCTFCNSLVIFSISLSVVSSPQSHHYPPASPGLSLPLPVALSKLPVLSAGTLISPKFRCRARVPLSFVLFGAASALSGYLSIVALCLNCDAFGGNGLRIERLVSGPVGFKGFAVGLCYGLHYLFERRWVLEFPVVQRPPWFRYKKCFPSAIRHALKLSLAGYLVSTVLAVPFLYKYNGPVLTGQSVIEQILFYLATLVTFLSQELCHYLHQVLHTKRVTFAPPKGSAAAETNPSVPLFAALEASIPRSRLQYLAYLDLCMVSELNVDTWRRAAFFEKTGETYKRVMLCLRPIEQLTSRLGDGLDSCSTENSFQASHQLRSPSERPASLVLYEPFYDFQLCAWCARIAASLTVHSQKEDRFGVAQHSGSNAAVVSTLLSCLLAVETFIGKKNNLQSSMQDARGQTNIILAALSTERSDATVGVMGKRKGNPHSNAYAMVDILRTSIYHIVSHFHNEMLNGSKAGLLEKYWIISSKPLYGSRELLLQKLHQFLDFQACPEGDHF